MKEHITKQDLLNIGLSKNYVKSILARIQEYDEELSLVEYKDLKELKEKYSPIQEHEMTWGKEYEE